MALPLSFMWSWGPSAFVNASPLLRARVTGHSLYIYILASMQLDVNDECKYQYLQDWELL